MGVADAKGSPEQFTMDFAIAKDHPGGVESVADTFRRLYYHFYTNGEASRAERIIADISLTLLVKLAVEVNGGAEILRGFVAGQGRANSVLLPLLRESYPGLVDRHDRFALGDAALRQALIMLDDVRLSAAPAHVLGEAFQALMGPRLRGDKGQFFTPRSLVRAMVRIIDPRPGESVVDPACGTGGFLGEAHVHQQGGGNGSLNGELVGCDKDQDLCRLASALLQISSGNRSRVLNQNSLDIENNGLDEGQFDVVLTNPPFGAKIGVRDDSILTQYALAHQWVKRSDDGLWQKTNVLGSSQDPQVLFLELCVRLLRNGGRMGIVLPEGMFGNKKIGYIWSWLRSQGRVIALLDCPRTTFQPGTDTKTNVLFFERSRTGGDARDSESVSVAVALTCGHDRRGRTHLGNGDAHSDDFTAIAADYDKRRRSRWRRVRVQAKSEYLVPRYLADKWEMAPEERALVDGAQVTTLGELMQSNVLSVRKGHEVGSQAYGTGNIPFIRTSDLSNFEISADPTKSVSEDVYEQYAEQQRLMPGDILMVVDGRYRIGTTALLGDSNHRCVVQSHLRILGVRDEAVVEPIELLFALNLASVKLRIRNLVFVQSTLGTLGKRLLELEIPILHGAGPWQKRVETFADVLRRRNAALSELSRMTAADYEL